MKTQSRKLIVCCVFSVLMVCPLAAVAIDRPGDDDIRFWVKDAINGDPYIDSSGIDVGVSDGIVTLSGDVKNLISKTYADREAKKISGVLGVINRLTVSPSDVNDTDIVQNVRRRIVDSAAIESQNIIVTCADGKVKLTGEVASWSEGKQAGLLAGEVRGVKSIENDLTVNLMFTRSDEAVKKDIQDTLQRDVYLIGLPIDVTVTYGFVTLSGTVGSEYQKSRAYEDVIWIENVKNIKNDILVQWWEEEGSRTKPPYNVTDTELAKAVTDELQQDGRLDPRDLAITASYGHVTLIGSVADYYQKSVAEKDAHDVVGVGWITNNLVVRAARRDDSEIGTDILFEFSTDAALCDQDIKVNVNNGVVTLSGRVSTGYDREHALTVASRIRGVKEVKDKLEVNWKQEYKDADLMGRLMNRIKSNWLLSPVWDKIKINVRKGVVTLTGTVYNWGERREAERIVRNTSGVRAIDNRIQVEGYNYNWEDWYLKDSDGGS